MTYDQDEDLLGRGKFGVVFKARDLQLDGDIAVKCIAKHEFTGDFEEFFAEAAVLFASRHAHVMQVLYACEDEHNLYIAMPVYAQGTVATLISASNLSMREIIRLGLGMLNGLHHVHTLGLIHGDVTPSNVLISDSGQAIVSDFGLSKYLLPQSGTAEFPIQYHPHWAPEYLQSTSLSSRADVYQAGLTIYRMIHGLDSVNNAWDAAGDRAYSKLRNGALLPWQRPPNITQRLYRALKRALAADPDNRIGSCLDFANELAKESEMLDWRPEPIESGTLYKSEGDDRQGIVKVVTASSGKWLVESTKKRGTSRQRVRDYCDEGLSRAQAINLASSAMKALEG